MRFQWLLLLSSLWSVLLFSLPADAARLLLWRFDASQNRLVFTTEGGVQPKAQLIADPTRLVIDLPGTTLGRATVNQTVGGAIREVRVGQFDAQTTRIVVELAPGYTLDPQQVKFQGASPSQWSVQLPAPQRLAPSTSTSPPPPPTRPPANNPPRSRPPANNPPPRSEAPPSQPATGGTTAGMILDSFQVTRDGFFVRTRGGEPENIQVRRSRDRQTIDIDVKGASLSSRLSAQEVAVNRFGVSQLKFSQEQSSPPTVRMSLKVTRESPDWGASFNSVGGLVVLPQGPVAVLVNDSSSAPTTPPAKASEQLATIDAVELSNNGTQLLIRANQSIRASSRWERSVNAYQITIPNAKLADNVRGPQLDENSSVSQIRIRQQNPQTVVILVQPRAGVQVGELNQPSEQFLALELRRERPRTPNLGSIPVPPPTSNTPTAPLPRVPNSRVVVIVDPGHGGKDPGTIGIGGVYEKNIILPISQEVAALLERQGVQAVLTRNADYFVDLAPRVAMAERTGADLFVSIHANAINLSRPDVNGLETYYYSSGQGLAQTIHNSILQNVQVGDRGVRRARFYVLRNTSMPSVLVEVGFLTGRDDFVKLSNPTYRSQMAQAIARGILQYIQQSL